MTAMTQPSRLSLPPPAVPTKQQNKNYFVATVDNGKMKVTFRN